MNARIYPLGDRAWNVELGNDSSAQPLVLALDTRIARLRQRGHLSAITECQPSVAELCVHYNPDHPHADELEGILPRLCQGLQPKLSSGQHHQLPICFAEVFAPDLAAVAQSARLSTQQIVELMLGCQLKVYTFGFLPGFAYLGDIPRPLRMPRLATPRTRVAAGSLAIAESMAAVYPFASPGGWRIIGRCPQLMFNPESDPPSVLQPGDSVSLRAISLEEYQSLQSPE